MWNTTLWLEDVLTWAVILALPLWLLAEEILHRLPNRPSTRPATAAPHLEPSTGGGMRAAPVVDGSLTLNGGPRQHREAQSRSSFASV
jgi:hypothetical protein